MIRRYFKMYYEDFGDYETVCDAVWYDRLDGKIIFSYDAADPANTNPEYGAPTETERFYNRNRDLAEMVDEEVCIVGRGEELKWHEDHY